MTLDELALKVVGMRYDDAYDLALKNKLQIRISTDNGVARVLTRDYRTDRLNVDVVGDSITAAKKG